MNIEQAHTARTLPPRHGAPKCFIVHGTGQTEIKSILKFYQSVDGLCPHYVIGVDGRVFEVATENLVAYHAATLENERALYRMGYHNWSQFVWKDDQPIHIGNEFPGYRGWREAWFDRGYQSPLDLMPAGKTNAATIGIELVTPKSPSKKLYQPAQYEALAELLVARGAANGIPINRETVLGHSDVNPLRRCNEAGSWDPGYKFDYNHLWDLVTAK